MIFVTTSRLSPWENFRDVSARKVTVNPTLNELVSGAYGDAPQEPQLTGWEQEHADWLSEKQEQAWLIGGDVLFGSSAWFDEQPEVPF